MPKAVPFAETAVTVSNGVMVQVCARGVQPFGISVPPWKKKCCLGPHIKYVVTCDHTQKISSYFK